MMKIAVLGYGVVGKGVVEILDRREDCQVDAIFARETVDDIRYTSIVDPIIHNPEINIVVEAMGGLEPAYSIAVNCLKEGKHFVTSNKAMVAKYGASLHKLAKEHGVNFLFEASVGGGIPIISTLRNGLAHEPIYHIEAILNGTSNYILSEMNDTKAPFESILQNAQRLGYAERDPSDDIDGVDTARKCAILGSILTGHLIDSDEIFTVGIRNIHTKFFEFADTMGYKLKLIASLSIDGEDVSASVEPMLIPKKHPLYAIDGVENAVCVHGKDVGSVMLSGPGAGRMPTASAVVADVLACKSVLTHNTAWDDTKLTVSQDSGLYAVWSPVESEMTPFTMTAISVLIMNYEEAIASGCQFIRIEGEL